MSSFFFPRPFKSLLFGKPHESHFDKYPAGYFVLFPKRKRENISPHKIFFRKEVSLFLGSVHSIPKWLFNHYRILGFTVLRKNCFNHSEPLASSDVLKCPNFNSLQHCIRETGHAQTFETKKDILGALTFALCLGTGTFKALLYCYS